MTRRASLEDLPPPQPMNARQWATFLQYLTVWETAAWLPAAVADRLPGVVGRLWHRFASDRQRQMVRINLGRAAGHPPPGELADLVEAAYVQYARYWLEAFRAHRMDTDGVLERTVDDGTAHIDETLADGKGAILATGHLGSWDIGAFFSDRRGWDLTVVAELVEPRPLYERFVKLRRRAGLGVIPLVRGGDLVGQLEQVVRSGGLATLLSDRDLTKKGPVVEFFGEPCRLPPGPAVLAQRTGRPVITGAFFTTPGGWRAYVQEPIDIAHLSVEEGTQAVARELERLIAVAPEQWHVFVPQWLAEREPDHPAVSGMP